MRFFLRVALLITLVALLPLVVARAQDPNAARVAAATGLIEGKVLDAATGVPIAGVRVALTNRDNQQGYFEAVTDATGVFSFTQLRPGTYLLQARRAGYVAQEYGQRWGQFEGAPVTLEEGGKIRNLSFTLTQAGVISGHVIDSTGNPVEEAEVRARLLGEQEADEPWAGFEGRAHTDDRGQYRMYGLPPGKYIVSALPRAQSDLLFRRRGTFSRSIAFGRWRDGARGQSGGQTFYPRVLTPELAQTIAVLAGTEHTGIDITLLSPMLYSIAGRVEIPTGTFPPGTIRTLIGTQVGNETTYRELSVGADGAFFIPRLPPGTYEIQLTAGDGNSIRRDTTLAIRAIKLEDRDISDVFINLERPASLSGRFLIAGKAGPVPGGFLSLTQATSSNPARAHVSSKSDGAFTIPYVSPGLYLFFAYIGDYDSSQYYFRSARLGGHELHDKLEISVGSEVNDFELIFGADGGILSGLVLGPDNLPMPNAQVTLRRSNEQAGILDFKHSRTDQQGRFKILGIRPDEYEVEIAGEKCATYHVMNENSKLQEKMNSWNVRIEPSSTHIAQLRCTTP